MKQEEFEARVMVRFFSKVDKTETCWNWTGPLNKGYGKFTVRRATISAHRFLYKKMKGEIPAGLVLDHTCFNPKCVNPDHLEPVTQKVNLHRSDTFQARNAKKTHCPQGHPYSETNLFIRSDGSRSCRECARLLKERRRRQDGGVKIRGPYKATRQNQANIGLLK